MNVINISDITNQTLDNFHLPIENDNLKLFGEMSGCGGEGRG